MVTLKLVIHLFQTPKYIRWISETKGTHVTYFLVKFISMFPQQFHYSLYNICRYKIMIRHPATLTQALCTSKDT